MKNIIIKILLALVITNLSLVITKAQTWKELMDSTIYYDNKQDFQTALVWAKQALAKAEREFGTSDTVYYSKILGSCAEYFYYSGKVDSAIFYQELNLNLCRRFYSGYHPILATAINNMAHYYQNVGNFKAAEPLFKEALEMNRSQYKVDHPSTANSINSLAWSYESSGRYAEADSLYNEGLKMYRHLYTNDNPSLANCINDRAAFYTNLGRYDEAEPLFKEALEMNRRIYKEDHNKLAKSIEYFGGFYYRIGRYAEAEPLIKEALDMNRRLFKSDHPSLAITIKSIADFNNNMGNYKEAELLYKEALEMKRRLYKTDHPDLAISINSLAKLYNFIGNYKEAESQYKEALEMNRRLYKTDHPDLAMSINDIAVFYLSINNFKEAEPLFKEALEMDRRLFKGNHPSLATAINNMAYYYEKSGNYNVAERLYNEALDMRNRIYKGDHSDKVSSINNLAMLYKKTGNYYEAEILYKESLEMVNRIYYNDHPTKARSINNLAMLYIDIGKYKESEALLKEALDMNQRLFKGDHPDLAVCFFNSALINKAQSKLSETELLYDHAISMFYNIYNKNSTNLSEKEKKEYWSTMSRAFEGFNHFAILRQKENPSILCKMYDYQLLTKAMLYNSTAKIKKRVLSSNDSALKADYKEFIYLKERLVKYYNMTNAELEKKQIKIDSLEALTNDLEKMISHKSEDYKQSYEKKKIDWRTIQMALKPDEAAIEMVRFRTYNVKVATDTVLYAALVVSEQTIDHPELILLENGNALEESYYPAYRMHIKSKTLDKESFNAFWEKIYEKTKQYKKIYFSPDGIYNKLNVSTLELPDGQYLLEKQDIQTVNSTKDLLLSFYSRHEESNVYNSALLIGNPKFDLDTTKLKAIESQVVTERDGDYYLLHNLRNVPLSELRGTEKEIKNIEQFLKSKKWDVETYTKEKAIKTRVKNANNPRVLHIATHGFFLPDTDSSNKYSSEINPLLKTGLFFAGASTEKSDENLDMGFLTAYESMNLDLDKTELVVLSACETGLGEIMNGEGVFGLRRAFQQAGARSVLMSLWKVNDEATQELMSSFYKNWITGMTKRDAFSKAQQEVRKKFKDPYYWGAFVMVGE